MSELDDAMQAADANEPGDSFFADAPVTVAFVPTNAEGVQDEAGKLQYVRRDVYDAVLGVMDAVVDEGTIGPRTLEALREAGALVEQAKLKP